MGFLLKQRVVSAAASESQFSMRNFLMCGQFLVQVLGVVQLSLFVRHRLFIFIFGGEDGILQQEEIQRMNVWNALLAKRRYRDLSFPKFIVAMLSFSEEDFQKLVLNEP